MNSIDQRTRETALCLHGMDGANLLAFMASLGTLRGLTVVRPEWQVRMLWQPSDTWRPHLVSDTVGPLNREDVVNALGEFIAIQPGHDVLAMANDLTVEPSLFREQAHSALEQSSASLLGRAGVDFMAAFGCDAVKDSRKNVIRYSAFCLQTGGGGQHFLKTLRDLDSAVTDQHLEQCLFEEWSRQDAKMSLRWDPNEDRRYALRASNPSDVPALTEWGANRLAMEGLPLYPAAPQQGRLATVGFQRNRNRQTHVYWPIWERPAALDTVRSLLSHPELQKEKPDRPNLQAMGVAEIFRCQRISVGKYLNFAPAEPA